MKYYEAATILLAATSPPNATNSSNTTHTIPHPAPPHPAPMITTTRDAVLMSPPVPVPVPPEEEEVIAPAEPIATTSKTNYLEVGALRFSNSETGNGNGVPPATSTGSSKSVRSGKGSYYYQQSASTNNSTNSTGTNTTTTTPGKGKMNMPGKSDKGMMNMGMDMGMAMDMNMNNMMMVATRPPTPPRNATSAPTMAPTLRPGNNTNTTNVTNPVVQIDLSKVAARFRPAFVQAQAKWSSVVTKHLSNVTVSNEIRAASTCKNLPNFFDTVYICGNVSAIDGPGSILGQAGPEFVRTGTPVLPAIGSMQFDEADVNDLMAEGSFGGVVVSHITQIKEAIIRVINQRFYTILLFLAYA